MSLPLDWDQWQLWALTLLLFYHGGSHSAQAATDRADPLKYLTIGSDLVFPVELPADRTQSTSNIRISAPPPEKFPVIGQFFLTSLEYEFRIGGWSWSPA